MKESDFINQNKSKWLEVEKNLTSNDISPSDTSKLFIQITDDLSYARTFYKNRSVKVYLNEIAKYLFNEVNKTKASNFKSFLNFWKTDLPLVMYAARRSMLISFIVFTACFILGVITSRYDPEFCRSILSTGYIDMTNENIAKGDAMAVYKSDGELETFIPIFINNIRVDFITFFSGIFMGIGTLFIMIFNGVMVGVFQYFFISKGLFWESFLAIWTHGTLEISTIILSGGAGLTLGKGFLFPGTYSRFDAFRASGMQGLKIIMGVAPITLLAAFIEGFLTRHTNIPDPIRFSFILLSLAFVLVYFFWYPRKVAKNTPNANEVMEAGPIYKVRSVFNPDKILTREELMKQSLRLFLKNFKYLGTLLIAACCITAFLISVDSLSLFYNNELSWFSPADILNYSDYPALAVVSFICFAFVEYSSFIYLRKKLNPVNNLPNRNIIVNVLLFNFLFIAFMLIVSDGLRILAFVLLPLFSLIISISAHQNISLTKAINLTGSLLNKQLSTFIIGAVFSFIIGWVFFIAIAFGTRYLLVENTLVWLLSSDEAGQTSIRIAVSVFQAFVSITFYMMLNTIYNSILFYTLKEINTAEDLISRIQKIKAAK